MKRKFFCGIFILTIAVTVAFYLNSNTQVAEMSSLYLANVEALANDEVDAGRNAEKKEETTQNTVEKINGVTMDCIIHVISCPGVGKTMCHSSYSKDCFEK